MNPDIFTFGELRFPPYPTMLTLSFMLCFTIGFFESGRAGLNRWRALEAGIISTGTMALIGARMLYVILEWDNFMMQPGLIFSLRFSGLSVHGAIAGAFLGVYLWSRWRRESFLNMTDFFTPYWALAYALVRVGCFFGGCCFGKVSDVPWAVIMNNPLAGDLPRHPVQLYLSIGALLGFIFFIAMRRRRPFTGFISFSMVSYYAVLRFVFEFFREMNSWPVWMGLTEAQLLSIAMFISSTALILYIYFRNTGTKNRGFAAH